MFNLSYSPPSHPDISFLTIASLMVEEGIGYALCLDRIIKTSENSALCFRPLEPKLEVGLTVAWKKYQVFSKTAEKFLEHLQNEFAER